MLINVGEAYIVVNILNGAQLAQDQDLLQYQEAINNQTGQQLQTTIHIPGDLDFKTTEQNANLKLKIFGGPSAGEVYYYSSSALSKDIVIGRTPDCDIRINDKLLSKSQASIRFAEQRLLEGGMAGAQQTWVLSDGFQGKPSTNGTWLYLNEDFQMHEGMIFKANQTIFSVSLKTQVN